MFKRIVPAFRYLFTGSFPLNDDIRHGIKYFVDSIRYSAPRTDNGNGVVDFTNGQYSSFDSLLISDNIINLCRLKRKLFPGTHIGVPEEIYESERKKTVKEALKKRLNELES